MQRVFLIVLSATFLAHVALAEDPESQTPTADSIPTTVSGGGQKLKEGGKEIGAGFKAIGRGIKDVFTGQRSKEDFEDAGKIGDGVKDLGRGTAGVGRGIGHGVKKGFEDEDDADGK